MPTALARKGAQADKRAGKKASVQAGNYVREEMHALKHSMSKTKPKSREQAIAIGLSEARRDGIKVPKRK